MNDHGSLGSSSINVARRASRRLPGLWGRRVREVAKWATNYNGSRRTALRGWKFARAARHSDLLLVPFGDGRMLVDAHDEEISRVVYMRGDYERIYMRVALQRLAVEPGFSARGRTLIDVGANIGTTTLDGLVHFDFANAICIEPDPHNVRLLKMNLALNDLAERASVLPVAASDRDEVVTVVKHARNLGDSRVTLQDDASGTAVRSVRLDSLVADGTVDLDRLGLVWIDAQGHDPRVLNGAASITSAGVPVVVEYWPDGLGTGPELELLERIVSEHYSRIVDLRVATTGRSAAEFPANEVRKLRQQYGKLEHTDLLLLR